MEASIHGPVIHRQGSVEYYGAIRVDEKTFVLDDPVILEETPNPALYRLHTITKVDGQPAALELVRLFRPTEISGGMLPYHAEKEVIFSNRFETHVLDDLKFCQDFSLLRRNAFILQTSFPDNTYFYQSPEYYWVDCPSSSTSPKQVQEKPLNLNNSSLRNRLPQTAINRSYNMRIEVSDEITDSQTSPAVESEGSIEKSKPSLELHSEDSCLIDLEKSDEHITKNGKRLRRLSSEAGVFGENTEEEDSPSLADSNTNIHANGDAQQIIDLSDDEPILDDIETPPPYTGSKGKSMWTYSTHDAASDDAEGDKDKDNWFSRHLDKQKKASPGPSAKKRDGGEFRASLIAATTEPTEGSRTTKLSKASTNMNNYATYASEDGTSTTTSPPQNQSSKPAATTASPSRGGHLLAKGMTCIDSDDEQQETSSSPVEMMGFSSPSKAKSSSTTSQTPDGKKSKINTWRPPGPRQTTISFSKAPPQNVLDAAVLVTGSTSPSSNTAKDSKPSQPSSTKKKKAIMPLQIDGVPVVDAHAILMSQTKARSKRSSLNQNAAGDATQDVSPPSSTSKKRGRVETIISDDEDEKVFSATIGDIGSGPYKLRQISPSQFEEPGARSLGRSGQLKKRKVAEEEDEEDSQEMKGFIVSDDEDIEYDTKARFADEEPTDPELTGYLRDSSSLGNPNSMELSQDSFSAATITNRRREFLGEFASLDLQTAFKRFLQYLISSVINVSFAGTWIGSGSRSDSYFTPALRKVIDKVNGIKNSLLASSVWSEELKEAIDIHPHVHETTTNSDGVEATCQACRRKHVATQIITLSGVPYDAEAFWNGRWVDNPSEDAPLDTVAFRAGPTCSKRIMSYHKLHHLQYRLVELIKPRVEKARAVSSEEPEILKMVLDNESWVDEMARAFEMTLEAYTEYGLKAGTRAAPSDEIILDE